MRMFLAILVCKLGRFVGKLVGKGSSMPGKFALKICPDILARVRLPTTSPPFLSVSKNVVVKERDKRAHQ